MTKHIYNKIDIFFIINLYSYKFTMETHLKDIYGFNTFRNNQKDIIKDLLKNEDVFVILPTGGGKSLLYQFPATFTDKITIVVSPLISLMNDQCKYLNSKNIKAICLNSETSVGVGHYTKYKIIYTTPEFIVSRLAAFHRIKDNIGLFAIDEAHCVSQWSHDFRPSYQKLGILKKHFANIPVLAVTATATPRVLKEMHKFLNISKSKEYILGTKRTNIMINVLPKSKFSNCSFNEPTIIYVQTRKICDNLCIDLKRRGILTERYHGGMDKKDKEISHNLFISGEIMVIVATISFGMGIDKSDIRQVINYGVPSNIESYYQEIGRAGRDGVNSKATIFYNDNDFSTTSYLISLSTDEEQKKIKTIGMDTFRRFLKEKYICRHQIIEHYFKTGEFVSEEDIEDNMKCEMCDNCLIKDKRKLVDRTEESKKIISIIKKQHSEKGYYVGMTKTLSNIKKNIKKKNEVLKEIIELLVSKKLLSRYKAGKGFVIGIGSKSLNNDKIITKIDICNKIDVKFKKSGETLIDLMELRNTMAKKMGLPAASFINDRVLMNINRKSPKNLNELWKVNGISKEFIMSNHCSEFMEKYLSFKTNAQTKSKYSKECHPKSKTKDSVLLYYKQGKTIKEISSILNISENTIENHVLYMYEHNDDIDIIMDYFGLTEEKEERIKLAIEKVGKKYLKPIKMELGKNITYSQIKLYLLVLKFEQ